MSKEMLSDFKDFIRKYPVVGAEVVENATGTYLLLNNRATRPNEQYMIYLTAEKKQ